MTEDKIMLNIFKNPKIDQILSLYSNVDEGRRNKIRKDLKQDFEKASEGKREIFGVELDGDFIGTGQLVFEFEEGKEYYADNKNRAHVTHVRVARGSRGKGLGKELMSFIESRAYNDKFKEITLGVDKRNDRALKFYEKLGYKKFKEEKGDEGEVIICMKKNL